MGVNGTVLTAITTPQDELNYFSMLMDLKDQYKEPLFYTIKLGLICARCEARGTPCTHLLDMAPEWKSRGRTAKVDSIMSCNPTLRDRETRGVITSGKLYFVSRTLVDALRIRPPFMLSDHTYCDVLYTAIDPSGGGSGSDYAIATLSRISGIPVVSVARARSSGGRDRSGRRQTSCRRCRRCTRHTRMGRFPRRPDSGAPSGKSRACG